MVHEGSYTKAIADFVTGVNFESIPSDVVNQTKRVILDTVGCALGGFTTDKGKICRNLVTSLGGIPESTILGTSLKTSCANASFVNANMANALDNDDCFKNLPHFAPPTICSALAIAERLHSTGKEVVTAVALGYDIAARVGSAAGFPLTMKDDRGEYWQSYGLNWEVFGPAITAVKLLGVNEEKTVDAIGIAGTLTPAPTHKFLTAFPLPMTKYADAGWIATSGVTAALLADSGYTGPQNILDPYYEFWSTFGAEHFDFMVLTNDLGKRWQIMDS